MGTREGAEQEPRAAQLLPLLGVHVKSFNCPLLLKGVYCVCVCLRWSGLAVPTLGDLLNPGIKPASLACQSETFFSGKGR